MSSQDNLERVLRDIHVLISRSEAYGQDRIIVNKQEMFELIDRLNASIYEIMEEYELTKMSRDKAEREHKKQGDKIIWDASRKAEDIYAASVLYTDEALGHIQEIMDDATAQIRATLESVLDDMEEKKEIVRTNQLELKSQLQDLVDTEKYLMLIEERNKEIEREREKQGAHFGQKEKDQFADVKTEIRINEEYFRARAAMNGGDDQDAVPLEDGQGTEGSQPLDADIAEGVAADGVYQAELPESGVSPDTASADADPAENKEVGIDLSNAVWDVDELKEAKEQQDTGQRRHRFFRHGQG